MMHELLNFYIVFILFLLQFCTDCIYVLYLFLALKKMKNCTFSLLKSQFYFVLYIPRFHSNETQLKWPIVLFVKKCWNI